MKRSLWCVCLAACVRMSVPAVQEGEKVTLEAVHTTAETKAPAPSPMPTAPPPADEEVPVVMIIDVDGDGVEEGADCNDQDSLVSLMTTFYGDADGDGHFGGAFVYLCSATPPLGYSAFADDCQPYDPSAHAPLEGYLDLDGDGAYGTFAPVCGDALPATHAVISTDCDDTTPFVRPGRVEVPDNGKDDDCSGGDLKAGSYASTLFVNKDAASCDSSGLNDGKSASAPLCDISAAVDRAVFGSLIAVAGSDTPYDEVVLVEKSVTLFGGYDVEFSGGIANKTIIGTLGSGPSHLGRVFIQTPATVTLGNVTIAAGAFNDALRIEDAADVRLFDVTLRANDINAALAVMSSTLDAHRLVVEGSSSAQASDTMVVSGLSSVRLVGSRIDGGDPADGAAIAAIGVAGEEAVLTLISSVVEAATSAIEANDADEVRLIGSTVVGSEDEDPIVLGETSFTLVNTTIDNPNAANNSLSFTASTGVFGVLLNVLFSGHTALKAQTGIINRPLDEVDMINACKWSTCKDAEGNVSGTSGVGIDATTFDPSGAWRIDVNGQTRAVPLAIGAGEL